MYILVMAEMAAEQARFRWVSYLTSMRVHRQLEADVFFVPTVVKLHLMSAVKPRTMLKLCECAVASQISVRH